MDDEYIEKMEDVLETYDRPYDPDKPVVCLDEKPVTLHADIRPPCRAAPGREARRDSEYGRCGMANVFSAVEPKGGCHFTSPTPDRSAFAFACFLCDVALQYPAAKTIHLVMYNLNTFGGNRWWMHLARRWAARSGNDSPYTPKHGSWLNQAETEISLFARQCLGKRSIPDLNTLRRETRTWDSGMNRSRSKINWKFDRRAAGLKFGYRHKSKPFKRAKT